MAVETEAKESTQNNHLIHKEEEKKEGAVAFHVYKAYWLAMGTSLVLSILFSLFLMQGEPVAQQHISLQMYTLLSFPGCSESREDKRPGS